MKKFDFGIHYVATGTKYIDEALKNAKFTKDVLGLSIPLSIATDNPSHNDLSLFDFVSKIPKPSFSYRDKIQGLMSLPFRYTLFLDTDAFVSHPLDDALEIVQRFDLSCTYAPVRHPPGHRDASIPACFPEVNTGVMFLSDTSNVRSLIKNWLHTYDEWLLKYDQRWDQASFRYVLWLAYCTSTITTHILPPEFNLRTTKPWIIGRGMPAYIIHGRYNRSELEQFIDYLNHDIDCFRTYSLWLDKFPNSSIRPRHDRTFS